MKLALIKLGSRVSVSSVGTSGGTGEALSIINILTRGNAEVDVYTKVLTSDSTPDTFNIFNIEDTYKDINSKGYDALLILNGNVNYFGGIDDPAQTLNYSVINNFSGSVFYIMCDANLFLKQIWQSVENKSWASNYKKEDIYITRKDIIYLSQARDVRRVVEKANKYVQISKAIYYPFEKFPLLTLKELDFNENPEYDILYGGTFRSGRREEDMIKYYFGYSENVNVEMFGKITLDNFTKNTLNKRPPNFGKSVDYDKFSEKMHSSKSTVIIGDKIYKELDDLAQRIYESIMIGNVVFIDRTYDYNKRVFKNKELLDFNYVNSVRDIEVRLEKLKDNDFRRHIIELQREDTKLNIEEYCNNLINIIKMN